MRSNKGVSTEKGSGFEKAGETKNPPILGKGWAVINSKGEVTTVLLEIYWSKEEIENEVNYQIDGDERIAYVSILEEREESEHG